MLSADRIGEKARDYDLSRLAAEERGEDGLACVYAAVALVLFELAELADAEEREAA